MQRNRGGSDGWRGGRGHGSSSRVPAAVGFQLRTQPSCSLTPAAAPPAWGAAPQQLRNVPSPPRATNRSRAAAEQGNGARGASELSRHCRKPSTALCSALSWQHPVHCATSADALEFLLRTKDLQTQEGRRWLHTDTTTSRAVLQHLLLLCPELSSVSKAAGRQLNGSSAAQTAAGRAGWGQAGCISCTEPCKRDQPRTEAALALLPLHTHSKHQQEGTVAAVQTVMAADASEHQPSGSRGPGRL